MKLQPKKVYEKVIEGFSSDWNYSYKELPELQYCFTKEELETIVMEAFSKGLAYMRDDTISLIQYLKELNLE